MSGSSKVPMSTRLNRLSTPRPPIIRYTSYMVRTPARLGQRAVETLSADDGCAAIQLPANINLLSVPSRLYLTLFWYLAIEYCSLYLNLLPIHL